MYIRENIRGKSTLCNLIYSSNNNRNRNTKRKKTDNLFESVCMWMNFFETDDGTLCRFVFVDACEKLVTGYFVDFDFVYFGFSSSFHAYVWASKKIAPQNKTMFCFRLGLQLASIHSYTNFLLIIKNWKDAFFCRVWMHFWNYCRYTCSADDDFSDLTNSKIVPLYYPLVIWIVLKCHFWFGMRELLMHILIDVCWAISSVHHRQRQLCVYATVHLHWKSTFNSMCVRHQIKRWHIFFSLLSSFSLYKRCLLSLTFELKLNKPANMNWIYS